MTDSIAIIGADGLIGRQLAQTAEESGMAAHRSTRRQTPAGSPGHFFLDLSYPPEGWQIPTDVSVAFLLAAETSAAYCRNHPESSRKINVGRTELLAKKFLKQGARVVFVSTNLVFDGSMPHRSHDDATCPKTEYGRQKAEAEKKLLALGDRMTIVRLTKILGPETDFVKQWTASLRRNEPVQPLSDMMVAPLSLKFVTEAFVRLAKRPISSIVQLSATEDVSYETVAKKLAERLQAPASLVRPVTAAQSGLQIEHLPKHTTLNDKRIREHLKLELPPVWSCLE